MGDVDTNRTKSIKVIDDSQPSNVGCKTSLAGAATRNGSGIAVKGLSSKRGMKK